MCFGMILSYLKFVYSDRTKSKTRNIMKSLKLLGTLILLIGINVNSYSQKMKKLDKSFFHCKYIMTFKNDSIQNTFCKDTVYLDIGKKITKFYSKYSSLYDSLRLVNDGGRIFNKYFNLNSKDNLKATVPVNRQTVFTHYPTYDYQSVIDYIGNFQFIYQQKLPKINWKISDKTTKVICGYNCVKAIGEISGREFTVWYAPKLKYSLGPWKLNGLPGLILLAYDDSNDYKFEAFFVHKNRKRKILLFKESTNIDKNYIKTSRDTFISNWKGESGNWYNLIKEDTGFYRIKYDGVLPVYRNIELE